MDNEKTSNDVAYRPPTSGPLDPGPLDPEPLDLEPSDPEPSDPEPSNPEPSNPEPSDPEPSDPGLPDVPFLELSEGRLQGVVSSESRAERVYASSIAAGDHGLSCCSNDDLLCGGLGEDHACRHIDALLAQAVHEFGAQRVARYLKIDVAEGDALHNGLHPTSSPSHAPEIFRSFLRHMTYLQMPVTGTPKL